MSMAGVAVSTMKTYHIVSLFFAFMFISTYGRELQENGTMSNIGAVSRVTTGQTNADDVDGLVAIYNKHGYTSLLDWYTTGGDPCLPSPLTWIECNSDPNPRVITLNLHNKLLYDALADFSSMDALQTIDLSLNGLMGVIPAFLGRFPQLRSLDLDINSFSGQIPDSIACNKNLTYSVDGNAYVLTISSACSSSTSPNQASPSNSVFDTPTSTSTPSFTYTPSRTTYKRKSKLPAILGGTGSILFLTSAAVGIFAIFRHKAKTADAIAAASAPPPGFGPDSTPINQKNMPTEERPMHSQPTNMSHGV